MPICLPLFKGNVNEIHLLENHLYLVEGYNVSRERVRQGLRSLDPLCAAARLPGRPSHRRPYSVAGPLSLWHIGIQCHAEVRG